ncbi:MAG: hypothetical protein FWF29_03850, partial [Treponema sp.]|nr:hypothetical protein [Treponema sp.]
MTIGGVQLPTQAVQNLDARLRSLIAQAYEWDPSNDVLKALFSVAGLEGKRKSFVISKKDVGDALALHTA